MQTVLDTDTRPTFAKAAQLISEQGYNPHCGESAKGPVSIAQALILSTDNETVSRDCARIFLYGDAETSTIGDPLDILREAESEIAHFSPQAAYDALFAHSLN